MVRNIVAGNEFAAVVAGIVKDTRRCLDIVVFDWRWFPFTRGPHITAFNQAIQEALQRGIKIRCIAQQKGLIDDLRKMGIDARKIYHRGLMHTKLIISDNEIVVLGSHNLTQAAFASNFELSVVLDLHDAAADFTRYFNQLYSQAI